MQAIKQTMKAPASRELRISLPDDIGTNADIEVILVYPEKDVALDEKLNAMAAVVDDALFRQDIEGIADDFTAIDREGWAP